MSTGSNITCSMVVLLKGRLTIMRMRSHDKEASYKGE